MSGLKMGMDFTGQVYDLENGMFWSQIGSGFGEPGGTPHHEFRGVPSPFFNEKSLLIKNEAKVLIKISYS